jgi:hypothetical protein
MWNFFILFFRVIFSFLLLKFIWKSCYFGEIHVDNRKVLVTFRSNNLAAPCWMFSELRFRDFDFEWKFIGVNCPSFLSSFHHNWLYLTHVEVNYRLNFFIILTFLEKCSPISCYTFSRQWWLLTQRKISRRI